MNPEDHRVNNLFQFLFRFYFVSVFQYLDCCYNEYPVKHSASLYLKFPLKSAFFVARFCYFWEDKSFFILHLFISEYLDQILS